MRLTLIAADSTFDPAVGALERPSRPLAALEQEFEGAYRVWFAAYDKCHNQKPYTEAKSRPTRVAFDALQAAGQAMIEGMAPAERDRVAKTIRRVVKDIRGAKQSPLWDLLELGFEENDGLDE
ncbi:MAG: hypothetical protein HOO67_05850 [Candidatus Peribacteraceae bacterium]|nr:hypothetical protein [Candidatus Peribacteraceae bacterium]